MYDLKTRVANVCGQKLISIYNKEFKTTSICITFRIGSINDIKGKSGLSYIVFYYLIFNSESAYNEIKELVLDIDITIQREYSMITVECDDDNYERVFELLMLIFSRFSYDNNILEATKKYVLQKYKIKHDSVNFCLDFLIHEAVFTRQVIGKSIYGKIKTLANIELNDLYVFYFRYYNNKNVSVTVSSQINHKVVMAFVNTLFQLYSFSNGQFSSFKKYRFSSKSKYLYRNFNICHCALVYKTSGIREYHNYIYLSILEKVIENSKEAIFGKQTYMFLNVGQFIYNRVGLFVFYFAVAPENIDSLHQVIHDLSIISVDSEIVNKIISQVLSNSKYYLFSSCFVAKSASFHFIHLKKIKKYSFDIGIMNSMDFSYLKNLINQIFNQQNVALCVTGPKINKRVIQILNGVQI